MTKERLLQKYGKPAGLAVGVAGYGFDKLYGAYCDRYVRPNMKEEQIERLRRDGQHLNEIWRRVIAANRNIVFVLKEHPGCDDSTKSEFYGMADFPNVIFVENEESISDVINACDFWVAYDSTTALEAWLLGKQTLLVAPSGPAETPNNLVDGSPAVDDDGALQAALNAFYTTGKIPGFDAREAARQRLITDIIQWADGKNHARAAYYIERLLEKTRTMPAPKPRLAATLLAYLDHWLLLSADGLFWLKIPFYRRFIECRKKMRLFDHDCLAQFMRERLPAWTEFHAKHPFTKEDEADLKRINAFARGIGAN